MKKAELVFKEAKSLVLERFQYKWREKTVHNVVLNRGSLSSGQSFIRAAFHQGGTTTTDVNIWVLIPSCPSPHQFEHLCMELKLPVTTSSTYRKWERVIVQAHNTQDYPQYPRLYHLVLTCPVQASVRFQTTSLTFRCFSYQFDCDM